MAKRSTARQQEAPKSALSVAVVEIGPSRPWNIDVASLWAYRELLVFLAWRDITVRYKQTVLGIMWALLQPLLLMVIFSVFFGRLGGLPSNGLPYPIFVLAGLLPWQMFAHALAEATNSLVVNERILTKVFFPRLILPIASVVAAGVDSLPGLVLLLGLVAYQGLLSWVWLWVLPVFALLALTSALAVGLWLSPLNAMYRDVRYTLVFLIQAWMFITPVVYPTSMVPAQWRLVYALNPMAGVVEGFRLSLFGVGDMDWWLLGTSLVIVVVSLAGGAVFFRRMESRIGDVL